LCDIAGSCKIDANCTATMVVSIIGDGSTITEVFHQHYGHKKEMQHTWISDVIRSQVAAKIHQGVSYDRILDDIMGKLTRYHLLVKKDIANIEFSFGLNKLDSEGTRLR
jgi:hypothetical protein